jgi:UDP-N-acetylglucosamine--N-acetylmuramyl-(pentapeptide) pyrophosphoryl-undecaprenol N-acetylglucosamine transferase
MTDRRALFAGGAAAAAAGAALLIPREANARALEAVGAARVLHQAATNPARLAVILAEWLGSPERLAEAARGAASLGRPQAARELADLVLAEAARTQSLQESR